MATKTRFWPIAAVMVALLAGACSSPFTAQRGCTLMGCLGEVTISWNADIPDAFTVTISGKPGEMVTIACDSGAVISFDGPANEGLGSGPCHSQGVTFAGYAPNRMTITVDWDGGNYSENLRPDYQVSQPNGPNCPPECRSATIVLDIP